MLCENTCCYTNIACLLISRHMQHNASTGKARLCNIILITVVETSEAEVASFPAQPSFLVACLGTRLLQKCMCATV